MQTRGIKRELHWPTDNYMMRLSSAQGIGRGSLDRSRTDLIIFRNSCNIIANIGGPRQENRFLHNVGQGILHMIRVLYVDALEIPVTKPLGSRSFSYLSGQAEFEDHVP